MEQRYQVRWTNLVGTKIKARFACRENAIRFLNSLILDWGCHDAKLTRVRKPKPKAVR